MARYRYTLKACDVKGNKEYIISLKEHGKEKEKVYLTTIDQFLLSHNTNQSQTENFKNKEELIQYLNHYYEYQIPMSSFLYISYQVDKEEKILEVVYDKNLILQYFSHLYTYYYLTTEKENDVKKFIKQDIVWQEFLRRFENNLQDDQYYQFIMFEEGSKYLNSYLKKWIRDYKHSLNFETYDERELFFESRKKIEYQFLYYKVLRGIELSYQKYEKLYHQDLDIKKEKIGLQVEKQRLLMPIVGNCYYSKYYEMPKQIYKTGYEELDDVIGDSATSISELSCQIFEELGLTLDDLERYPELKETLGYESLQQEEKVPVKVKKRT